MSSFVTDAVVDVRVGLQHMFSLVPDLQTKSHDADGIIHEHCELNSTELMRAESLAFGRMHSVIFI